MTITKIYCDHCGKTLDPMTDYIGNEMEIQYDTITADLCAKCIETLEKQVKEFCKRSDTE